MAKVFIDGQAGTTGLEIADRLALRDDLTLLEISDSQRKDKGARQELLQQADVAILCLPDAAAQAAVMLADGKTRLLDASTAHRVDPTWTYGLPELDAAQRRKIAEADCVSNPGCYPQGFILLCRPLVEAGVLSAELALRCHAVSGYSGGGRSMIEQFQAYDKGCADLYNSQAYALGLAHKHVPEMQLFSGTKRTPLFTPMVANYYKGMLVHLPLFVSELNGVNAASVHNLLTERYEQEHFIEVLPFDSTEMLSGNNLVPTTCNNTNTLQLMVFGNEEHVLLTARYDNLGKGASGAAIQNLNLMLGLAEHTGLRNKSL